MALTFPCANTRARRRSRYGCRNCKLRKLKVSQTSQPGEVLNQQKGWQCDEQKPHCKRCISLGVICNLVSSAADLEPIGAFTLVVHPPVSSAIWTADESISYHYQLNAKCQDFITRYLGKSLLNAVPDELNNMRSVNRKLLDLAFTVSARRPILTYRRLTGWLLVPFSDARFSCRGIHIRPVSQPSLWLPSQLRRMLSLVSSHDPS
jgi:hypothetical protein